MKLCTKTNFNNSRHKKFLIIDIIIVIYEVIVFADTPSFSCGMKGTILFSTLKAYYAFRLNYLQLSYNWPKKSNFSVPTIACEKKRFTRSGGKQFSCSCNVYI